MKRTRVKPKKKVGAAAFSAAPDLEDLRQQLASFAAEREWDQFHTPRNLALAMVGEVGELCEIFQWKGEAAARGMYRAQKQPLASRGRVARLAACMPPATQAKL